MQSLDKMFDLSNLTILSRILKVSNTANKFKEIHLRSLELFNPVFNRKKDRCNFNSLYIYIYKNIRGTSYFVFLTFMSKEVWHKYERGDIFTFRIT